MTKQLRIFSLDGSTETRDIQVHDTIDFLAKTSKSIFISSSTGFWDWVYGEKLQLPVCNSQKAGPMGYISATSFAGKPNYHVTLHKVFTPDRWEIISGKQIRYCARIGNSDNIYLIPAYTDGLIQYSSIGNKPKYTILLANMIFADLAAGQDYLFALTIDGTLFLRTIDFSQPDLPPIRRVFEDFVVDKSNTVHFYDGTFTPVPKFTDAEIVDITDSICAITVEGQVFIRTPDTLQFSVCTQLQGCFVSQANILDGTVVALMSRTFRKHEQFEYLDELANTEITLSTELSEFCTLKNMFINPAMSTDDIITAICESQLAQTSDGVSSIADCFTIYAKMMTRSLAETVKIIQGVSARASPDNCLGEFKQSLLYQVRLVLLFYLMHAGYYTVEEANRRLEDFLTSDFVVYFMPEMQDYYTVDYLKFYLNDVPDIAPLQKDNWAYLGQLRERNQTLNKVLNVIKADDLETLRMMYDMKLFQINDHVSTSSIETSPYLLDSPTYLSCSALLKATHSLKFLLMNGADPDIEDDNQYNSMYFAIIGGDLEIIKILEQAHTSMKSAIAAAIESSRMDILSWVLDHGASLTNLEAQNPLLIAARVNNIEAAVLCLKKGIPINSGVSDGYTAMHSAAYSNNITFLKFLSELPGFDITLPDNMGNTIVHYTAKGGSLISMKWLDRFPQLDFDAPNNYGETPLLLAVYTVHFNIVKYLVEVKKVNYNCQTHQGHTPLTYAISKRSTLIVNYLLGLKNIECNIKTQTGHPAFFYAISSRYIAMVELLMNDARFNCAASNKGFTPLHFAAAYSTPEIINKIITIPGIDVNARNDDGFTSLHLAVEANSIDNMNAVIALGADINATTDQNETPLLRAVATSNAQMVEFLLGCPGIDKSIATLTGETPLDVAKQKNLTQIEILLTAE